MLDASDQIRKVSDDWQQAHRQAVDRWRQALRETVDMWQRLHRETLKWMQIFGTLVVREGVVIFYLLLVIERS